MMVSTSSYNVSGVLYESDSETVDYEGKSYDYYLTSDFRDEKFKADYLARYIGKGPSMEHVLLLVPSVSPKVNENYEDSLRYVIKTLDSHLDTKYSLLICQTCVSWTDSNSYYFVNQWYNMLPKSKKKNLNKVYLVHAPVSTKTLLTLSTPFNSSKCLSKVEFVENLSDILHKLELNKKNMLRYFPYVVQRTEEINLGISKPLSPFGTHLWVLSARLGQRFKDFRLIPPVLSNVLEHLESKDFVTTPNLINLQCDAPTLYEAVTKVENLGENCSFKTANEAVSVFRLFLDTQRSGLLGPKALVCIRKSFLNNSTLDQVKQEIRKVISKLRPEQSECVLCIVKTLRVIARNAQKNGMTLKILSKSLAPSFFRPPSPDPYIYNSIPICETVVYTMIEKPGTYFSSDKDKEPQAKLIKSDDPEKKTRKHKEKEEDNQEHKSKEKSKEPKESERDSVDEKKVERSRREESKHKEESKESGSESSENQDPLLKHQKSSKTSNKTRTSMKKKIKKS